MNEISIKDVEPVQPPVEQPQPVVNQSVSVPRQVDEEEPYEDDDGNYGRRKTDAEEYAETLPGYQEYLREMQGDKMNNGDY